MNNLEAYKGVFVFAQQVDNVISNIAFELIGKGKELAKDLKQIYQAPTEEIGYNNLIELEEKWSKRKVSLDNWINNWDNIQPFFKYGPETRKIMYTTNAIESLNNSYKRLNKGRRVFPTIQ